jgi:eukaryotic-like serine/threonine-protein kinase
MPVDSAVDLVNALRLGHLLTAGQLEDLAQNLLPQHPDAKSLARALLDREWLTPYQVNMLLTGLGARLLLEPYLILERLGDNALGQVFKARHRLMNRAVTLTVVREELLAQPEMVEQFYREIQANSQLSDPHLVHAYDAGPIGNSHFFATEYVDGIDLDRLVQQSGRLPLFVASALIQQAAAGLAHAHERNLLHHDLRPGNLLVARLGSLGSTSITTKTPLPSSDQLRDATVKIAYLGLTMLQPRLRRSGVARSEDALDYVAPEQGQGATRDIRANLYSLGCIYYFLLTGRAPFSGGTSSVKLKQHQSEEPKPLDAYRRDVPAGIRDLIHKLLAKNPEDRYQTPAELLAALAIANPRPADVVLDRPAPQPKPPVKKAAPPASLRGLLPSWKANRSRLALIAGGVGLLFLLAVLIGLLLRSSKTSSEDTVVRPMIAPTPAVSGTRTGGAVMPSYVKKATRQETIFATLKACGLPTFDGKWWTIAPFDNPEGKGFDTVYPPEQEIDLTKTYTAKNNLQVQWKEWPDFRYGEVRDLKPRSPIGDNAVVYLYHEVEVPQAVTSELSLGSDDTLTVWLNGRRILAENVSRGAAPDQNFAVLHLQAGKNQLLIKICQGGGDWAVYVMPYWPESLRHQFQSSLDRDFPPRR